MTGRYGATAPPLQQQSQAVAGYTPTPSVYRLLSAGPIGLQPRVTPLNPMEFLACELAKDVRTRMMNFGVPGAPFSTTQQLILCDGVIRNAAGLLDQFDQILNMPLPPPTEQPTDTKRSAGRQHSSTV